VELAGGSGGNQPPCAACGPRRGRPWRGARSLRISSPTWLGRATTLRAKRKAWNVSHRLVVGRGRTVAVATSVAEGRAALASGPPPDLVVLDVGLPDGDGRDFCRALKGRHPQVAVILMSAYARAGVVTEAHARACGAEGFAPKPFDLDALRATAARLVRRPKAG